MKLIRIQEQPSTEANGEEETLSTWALTGEQYHILLNYAINDLVLKGLIEVSDMTKEEVEAMKESMAQDAGIVFGASDKPAIIN